MKKYFALAILVLLAFTTKAQSNQSSTSASNFFNLPSNLPVPKWAILANWTNPNVHQIDSLIRLYGRELLEDVKKEKEERRRVAGALKLGTPNPTGKTTYKKEDLEFEEPYFNAYVRWRRQMEPFVLPNGFVKFDSTYGRRIMQAAEKKQLTALPQKITNTAAAANWTIFGPSNTIVDPTRPSWHDHANVYRIAVAASNPNVLYCSTETGSIFKTTNKGVSWASASDNYPPASTSALAVNPTNSDEVYWAAENGAMLKSTTGGGTWTVLSSWPAIRCRQIIINPLGTRIIACTSDGRIYYSTNGGTIWTLSTGTSANGADVFDLAFKPNDGNIVYAASQISSSDKTLKMLRSTDGGASFTAATIVTTVRNEGARIGVSPADANIAYCLLLDGITNPKLIKSTDGGSTWNTAVNFNPNGPGGEDATNGLSNGQGYYDQICIVNALNANEVLAGTVSLYRSINGGTTFAPVSGYVGTNPLAIHPDMQSAVSVGGDTWMATDGGTYLSTDFFAAYSNMTPRHSGITGSDYWGFGQGWAEDLVVGGRYHNGNGAVYSGYGVGNSIALGGGEDATGHVLDAPGRRFDATFRDIGTITIPSTFNGQIQSAPFTNILYPQEDSYGSFTGKLMVDPRYSNVLYVGNGNKLWKSTNRGASYASLNDFGSKVWRFDIARSNPSVIYLLTESGIRKTTNGGSSWTNLTLPSGVTYYYYNADIAVDPANENNVWLCMAQTLVPSNKVFKSTDGGTSWVNYGGTGVNGGNISFILPHGGSATGGVYAVDRNIPSKVWYRSAATAGWVNYSAGLTENFRMQSGTAIHYGTNKMRMASNRGIWESPLYEDALPVAQPMADRQITACSRDTVRFSDYSILRYAGASWSWSFPGASFVSSNTAREPKVMYPGPGSYSVSLTVTDALGYSSSKTVPGMITFTADQCSVDTVGGFAFRSAGANHMLNIGTVGINSNSFSLSCWFKPNGIQNYLAQLICQEPNLGSEYGFGLGFSHNGNNANLNLAYTDNLVNYGNTSGLIADTTNWNYAVLTYAPTGVTLYLNGVPAVVNSTNPMPSLDLGKSPFFINADIFKQGSFYKGEIDEVKIYNYALSQNEVREKMHLIQKPGLSETGLAKYVQFNKIEPTTGDIYELVSGTRMFTPGIPTMVTSTAPVATGSVYRNPIVSAGGQHSFPGTGIDLFWPATGTFPNGELVGFKLNSSPDQKPNSNTLVPQNNYFIINNYGTNATFTPLDKMRFSNLPIPNSGNTAADFSLFKRNSTAWGSTWGTSLGTASNLTYGAGNSSYLEFTGGGTLNSFSQFVMSNAGTPLSVKLLDYKVSRLGNVDVQNKWSTSSEQNAKHFAIERSENGLTFTEVGRVIAKGNSSVKTDYTFIDKNAFTQITGNTLYYRLRMVSLDGSYENSPVRIVQRQSNTLDITIAPVPLGNELTVLMSSPTAKALMLRLYTSTGQQLLEKQLAAGITRHTFTLGDLPSGMYLIKITGEGFATFERLVTKL